MAATVAAAAAAAALDKEERKASVFFCLFFPLSLSLSECLIPFSLSLLVHSTVQCGTTPVQNW